MRYDEKTGTFINDSPKARTATTTTTAAATTNATPAYLRIGGRFTVPAAGTYAKGGKTWSFADQAKFLKSTSTAIPERTTFATPTKETAPNGGTWISGDDLNASGRTMEATTHQTGPDRNAAYELLRAANGADSNEQVVSSLLARWQRGEKLTSQEINALRVFRPELFNS